MTSPPPPLPVALMDSQTRKLSHWRDSHTRCEEERWYRQQAEEMWEEEQRIEEEDRKTERQMDEEHEKTLYKLRSITTPNTKQRSPSAREPLKRQLFTRPRPPRPTPPRPSHDTYDRL